MSDQDLRRLDDVGSGVPAILRSALGAARAASPDQAELASLAAKLPFGTPPPAAPAAAPAAGAAGAAAATPSVLSGALIGAALGVVVSGVGLFWPARAPVAPVAAPPAVATVPAGGQPAERVVEQAAPPEPAAPASGSPSAAPRPQSAPVSPSASAAPSASADEAVPPAPAAGAGVVAPDTETEAHLLERAQDALGSSPAQALALTGEHASRFPGGALGQEREVVAVQALLRLGRADEARARVARFAAAFPGSAHRRRLEALVAP